MVRLAILHKTLPSYIASSEQEELRHLELAFSSSDPASFLQEVGKQNLQVLVLDLALLGPDPVEYVEHLEKLAKPEMTLIVYAFAKWETVEALRAEKRHIMRAPLSVRALRSNLISLIVKQLTPGRMGSSSQTPARAIGSSVAALVDQQAPARRYDDVQLASLQEIESVVDCECPNQVADLVLSLGAFEDYSANCKNRNEADAAVHAMLYRATGQARAIMEEALGRLCQHENIDVNDIPARVNSVRQV
ncbi:hypothetical protein J2T57_000366 [Natronocella acetinitrilica]|uniref:Uncharacterized protein n=1 Tax=Natronocella acetinitrilica TaxID=414046 RepID=A0AAE3G1H3_9GAMM|nr:hypothetical protein [Natronocella acetinitrilica]MCP1673274.1 hypothetical protein [Natronocella acetinitrilica]